MNWIQTATPPPRAPRAITRSIWKTLSQALRQRYLALLCVSMILLGLLGFAGNARAQLSGDLNFTDSNGLPVATAHFIGEESAPVNITDVIRADLSRSGGLVNFSVDGAHLGLESGANLNDWRARGAQALWLAMSSTTVAPTACICACLTYAVKNRSATIRSTSLPAACATPVTAWLTSSTKNSPARAARSTPVCPTSTKLPVNTSY